MSDWSIVLLVIAGAFAVYRLFFAGAGALAEATAQRRDFARYFESLIAAEDTSAFLVIESQADAPGEPKGVPDFFQFAKSEDGLELDFPLVNERQRGQEAAVRAAAEQLGLEESRNSSGERSIDYVMGDQPAQIAKRTEVLFAEGLGVSPESPFLMKWYKMESPPG